MFRRLFLFAAFALSLGVFATAADGEAEDAGEKKENMVLFLFTESCFETYFTDFDFLNIECFKQVLSKAVGVAIIVFSFLLKAPQIYKMVSARSAKGLEPSALYLDVAAFVCTSLYCIRKEFPFVSYGENVVILVQNVIIVLLAWSYTTKSIGAAHKGVVVLALGVGIYAGFAMPEDYITVLPSITILLTIASRVPQLLANCRAKNTGVQSSITWFLNFVGAMVRVLTTLKETGDVFQLAGFLVGGALSFLMLLQILVYGDKKQD